jgi:hypothetical protein
MGNVFIGMEKATQENQETLESLRGTERALEKQLTTARRAIAELEARLAWSHSRVSGKPGLAEDGSSPPKPE